MSVVRAVPEDSSKGFRLLTYLRWFALEEMTKYRTWWYCLNEKWQVQIVAQFRMGSHWLNILHHDVRRNQRLCKCCDLNAREDELHFTVCSAYNDIRLQYADILRWEQEGLVDDMDAAMKRSMTPPVDCRDVKGFWRQFTFCLSKCRDTRQSITEEQ
jgi:hypothetical protein